MLNSLCIGTKYSEESLHGSNDSAGNSVASSRLCWLRYSQSYVLCSTLTPSGDIHRFSPELQFTK